MVLGALEAKASNFKSKTSSSPNTSTSFHEGEVSWIKPKRQNKQYFWFGNGKYQTNGSNKLNMQKTNKMTKANNRQLHNTDTDHLLIIF